MNIVLEDHPIRSLVSAEILTGGQDTKASNTFEFPNQVNKQPYQEFNFSNGKVQCSLPPLTFTAMTFKLEKV